MYARDTARIATPIGWVEVTGDETRVERVAILTEGAPAHATAAAVTEAAEQLQAFFAGERRTFDLSLAPAATPRGQALREAIVAVGYGETLSYGQIAARALSSARAVGQACARNPLPLIVPCHRVLATGGLGHYSAGAGLTTKEWLLAHERRNGSD
ncbi:methylated-DNA--[protein]-cysteine S-methyltransferase [Sphingomonas lenta]|uniref:Cysteine methyltransferase n=1 Tax=Sphingomonas lenta TaxID=1141887 RepID=A0A2A2SE79_9SPHN|nr:methylated-DNA--[protein]-cysteine S-methyltransferase [Sphingomonas lenta]PAX07492.1 cysteine methyltransferase [Sphingomonas lenta]